MSLTYEEARKGLLEAYERQKTEKFVVVSTKALETLLFGEYGLSEAYKDYGSDGVAESWGPNACDERVS